MAEMERMKADENAFRGFSLIQNTSKKALEKAYISVLEFGREESDKKVAT
jgi:3'-phosphoadenosine 5'-phosphosulfate sulfotransferase